MGCIQSIHINGEEGKNEKLLVSFLLTPNIFKKPPSQYPRNITKIHMKKKGGKQTLSLRL